MEARACRAGPVIGQHWRSTKNRHHPTIGVAQSRAHQRQHSDSRLALCMLPRQRLSTALAGVSTSYKLQQLSCSGYGRYVVPSDANDTLPSRHPCHRPVQPASAVASRRRASIPPSLLHGHESPTAFVPIKSKPAPSLAFVRFATSRGKRLGRGVYGEASCMLLV